MKLRLRKTKKSKICGCLFLLALSCCATASQTTEPEPPLDWNAIASKIAERLDPQPGERVILVGKPPNSDGLLEPLSKSLTARGAHVVGRVRAEGPVYPGYTGEEIVEDQPGGADVALYKAALRQADASILLPGAQPADLIYRLTQEALREGKGRTIHFHWEGAYSLSGESLPIDQTIDAVYQRAVLETDYESVGASQMAFEEAMRQAEVRVSTPLGTDLRFRIGDRPVTRQDGDASAAKAERARNLVDREIELPCGAIRVAPLEETVEGIIAFPPSVWAGKPVSGLRLRFQRGRVVEIEAEEGLEAVQEEMDSAGDAGRAFREFALGFNPLLAIPAQAPWIPYYGYGAGVVRLSLGDNSELGGQVTGGYVRWNFFVDATVRVGDEVWVRDGKLVK